MSTKSRKRSHSQDPEKVDKKAKIEIQSDMNKDLLQKVMNCYKDNDWKSMITILKTDGKTAQSITLLADAYYMTKNYKKMKPWCLKGIKLKCPTCMHHLARYYEIYKPKKKLMKKYFKQAIALKHTQSMNDYGSWLGEHGDRDGARDLWLQGAQLEDEDCCVNINRTLDYVFDKDYAAKAKPYLNYLNKQRLLAAEDSH